MAGLGACGANSVRRRTLRRASTTLAQNFGDELGRSGLTLHLLATTLIRCLIRSPPNKTRTVPKSAASHLVIFYFYDQFELKWYPFGASFGGPTTGSAGRITRETSTPSQFLQLFGER